MLEYPNQKILELNAYINNFNNDINEMKEIFHKINQWVIRGIDINTATISLNSQIQTWEKTMNQLLDLFTQNIKTLKQLDDRINDTNNIDSLDIVENNGTYIQRWEYLYSKYQSIFTNLQNDITILTNAKNSISNYQKLGIEINDAITKINNQVKAISDGISNSLQELQIIIDRIKDESRKILTNDEIGSISNVNSSYLAIYSTITCNDNSLLVFFNNNSQIIWNPIIDGRHILPYITRAIFDSNSPLYDNTIGNGMFYTNSTTPYNYGYYGFSKDNMIGFNINNNLTHGSIYEDRQGYQQNINIFYGSLLDGSNTNLLDKIINSFTEFGSTYTSGTDSIEKLYLIFSIDLINDFSTISFVGEE